MLDFDALNRARIAHGVLMSLAVILFFPIGGVLVRLLSGPSIVKVHIACQIVGLCILVAGFGLGLWFQEQVHIEWSDPHQTLGTVLTVLFLCMPVAGAFNHWRYRKFQKKTKVGHIHVWTGRVLIVVSLINGGFGLKLAREGSGGKIAYAVLAAVTAVIYGSVLIWWYFFGGKRVKESDPAPIEMHNPAVTA